MVNESHSSDPNKQTSGVTIDAVKGGIHDSIIAGRDVMQHITNILGGGTSVQRHQRNRRRMLDRVKTSWIKGVLERSVHDAALIELGKQEQADAIDNPWEMVLETPDQQNRTLPSGKQTIDIFEEMGRALLILGAPGSGKTITLLELARDAIARAERDPTQPIPVVFNLSSWTDPKQSLADWLVDELNTKYHIPRKIGYQWITDNDLLLLLDGLDEVKPENRDACAQAINRFRQEYGLSGIVVCSRTEVCKALATRLKLGGAILIQPLTTEQIDGYFTAAGLELAALHTALRNDATLRELAQSPLMLSIMALAYRGLPAEAVFAPGALEERRNRLFDAYVERMLKRRGADKRYTPQQTIHWLVCLARMMSQHTQTEFFIEGIQPAWLPARAQRLLYDVGVRLAGGLAFVLACVLAAVLAAVLTGGVTDALTTGLTAGLAVGMGFGLAFVLASGLAVRLPAGLAVGLAAGLTIVLAGVSFGLGGGLAFGLAFGLPGGAAGVSVAGRDQIKIAETLSWSWRKAMWGLGGGLAVGLAVGLVVGLAVGMAAELADVLAVGLPVGLAFMLALGLTRSELVETRTTPNQGIRQSARNAIRIGLAVVLASVLSGVPVGVLRGDLASGLAFGLIIGLPIGLAAGLAVGGSACIQHVILRLILSCNGHIPWNLAHFLDYAAERIFLRKVGGGYILVHRLLLDYFAALET
jgi:hypothetical protein